jgi:NAD+ synthase
MSNAPTRSLKIALAQLNPVLGDLAGNVEKLIRVRADAARQGADLLVLPELYISGYPPEDLVRKPAFAAACRSTVEKLATDLGPGPAVLVGCVWPDDGKVYNAVALLDEGRIAAVRLKVDLPNYGVFDEKRVFDVGPLPGPILFRGVKLGVPICEDIWTDEVTECLAECGAELFIVPNGSPFDWKKSDVRMNITVARVAETGLPLAYLNQVGGQDELVFDGASFVINADASLAVQMPAWEEALVLTHWERADDGRWRCKPGERVVLEEGNAAGYHACVLGLKDYVDKNRFPSIVLGLSGGIDSALVVAMATDALGPDRVRAVMLPYRYTSTDSLDDAAACAKALGVRYDSIPIAPAVDGFYQMLAPIFANRAPDTTEENVQSRARGTTLMAISNKDGSMLLTTGNKSEMSVGYATIYGDMNGGFNPIKDLYKMEVYRLSAWRNANVPRGGKGPAGVVIPERILTKAPSAELRENQTDQDSLPPYEVLDDILSCLVEHEMSLPEIIARGHPTDTVKRIERLLYLAEYKRRQAAPGVKISSRSFGRDRRYPITNRFREDPAAPKPESTAPVERAPQLVQPRADGGDVS